MANRWNDSSFLKAALFSLFFHLLIAFLLLIPSFSNKPPEEIDELKAFTQALIEIKKENPDNLSVFDFNDTSSIEKYFMLLGNIEISGVHLKEKEKVKLYKDMFAAYIQIKESTRHSQIDSIISKDDLLRVLKKEGASRLGGKLYPLFPYTHSSDESLKLLPESKTNKLAVLEKQPEMKKNYVKRGNKVKVYKQEGNSLVPADYFFRNCPYEDLLALGTDLFSFQSGFWPLDQFGKTVDQEGRTQFSRSDKPEQKLQVFLIRKYISSKSKGKKIFNLKEEDKKSFFYKKNESIAFILDELMQYSEPEQFERFRQEYLSKYNLGDNNLAELTREFFYRNLGSVFFPISDKSEAFDHIEELFFNKSLNQNIYVFWKSHPESRVGDEILFYLASQIAFEKRALDCLIKAYPSAKKFTAEKYFILELHEEKSKCFVIKDIYEALIDIMAEKEIESFEELLEIYSKEQHKIYNHLIDKGGEIKNRGLYARGCLYWEEGQYAEAEDQWSMIDETFSSMAFNKIKEILFRANDPDKTKVLISDVLDYYAHKGTDEYLARLEKFKKWSLREKILF